MWSVFTPRANFVAHASLALSAMAVLVATGSALSFVRSSFRTGVGVEVSQPVPFSHQHHVAGLGIDCRYCHATVEASAFAGMPTTQTCMNCHARIWTDAPVLEPIRRSWSTGEPVRWNRVHDLPDFAYFDHSIHLARGVGCSTCHGRIDQMSLARKESTLFMSWCLDCHRNPEPHLRPSGELFNMAWKPSRAEGPHDPNAEPDDIATAALTDCSICHR